MNKAAHPQAIEATGHSAVCPHHWVIDTPNGALSPGRCKRCGVSRDFRNSSEELLWDSNSFSLSGSRHRGRGKREESVA